MTKDQVLAAVKKYREEIGIEAKCAESGRVVPSPRNQESHIMWMCDELEKMVQQPDCNIEKVMRWVGFIQGVLWAHSEYSIDEMKDDNR